MGFSNENEDLKVRSIWIWKKGRGRRRNAENSLQRRRKLIISVSSRIISCLLRKNWSRLGRNLRIGLIIHSSDISSQNKERELLKNMLWKSTRWRKRRNGEKTKENLGARKQK